MAGGEDEAQQVVANLVVERGVEVGPVAAVAKLARDLALLAVVQRAAAHDVDRTMLGGRHEPGAGIVGHARFGPALERGDERVLREIFRHPHVSDDAHEPGDESRRLDAPNSFDRAVRVGRRHRE